MVTVSKTISIPNEDLSDDTTPSVARKFLNKVKSSLVTLQRVVRQKMTLEIHNWSSSAHKTTYKNLFDFITSNRAHAKLHNLIYENAQLRASVFENTFESMNKISRTSVTPHVDKPKLSVVTPHSKKLHASIPLHCVPQPREFNVVKHRNMIAPRMFKINPSQTFRVDLMPNKQSSASIRTNLITISQRHVTFKKNVKYDMVTASSTGLSKFFVVRRLGLFQAYNQEHQASHQLCVEVFGNCTLRERPHCCYFGICAGITHETYAAKASQQNRVVERKNHTLVEAVRTMLLFSHALLFLWAEAIASACYTQNRSIIHCRFNKTP
nr:putative ribonuclease H-like domain-containing protein [Tanacetum cinerariifolium]